MRIASSNNVADEPHEMSTSDGAKSFLRSPAREAIPFDAMKYLLWLMVSLGILACGGTRPPGTVELGDLVVDGDVDLDYLLAQLPQLDPTFEACYVQALRKDRSTEGVIDLKMRGEGTRLLPTITQNGTNNVTLAECVTQAIEGLAIVQREGDQPWNYTADWSITFSIMRTDRGNGGGD